MKNFKFTLESLLSYKRHLEHLAQQATATAKKDVQDCVNHIKKCRKEIADTIRDLEEEATAGISAERFKIKTNYLGNVEMEIEFEENRLVGLKKVLIEKQSALKQKSIEKKVLDNLKEKKKEEYFKEIEKIELKTNDDMIVLRKAREGSI